MLFVVPILAYGLLYVLFQTRSGCWRASFLNAAVAWGTLVVLVSEGLGAIDALTPAALAIVWAAIDLILAGVAAIRFGTTAGAVSASHSLNLDSMDFLLLAGLSAIFLLVGLTAVLSPPNTSDVMTYHLPRIVHWLQQRSLAFYPTQEIRQLAMPPGAELWILQFHALAGGDSLDHIPQWWSFLGSAIGVSLVAGELGAGGRGQVLASVVCATIPQGILTASSAKNDYVLSFWLVVLTWYVLRYSREENSALLWGIGGAFGLALLTKGTAVVLATPLLLCLSINWTPSAWKRLMTGIPLVILVVVSINLGYWARNARSYGFPLGPAADPFGSQMKYTNHKFTPGSLASNVVRNMALHLGTTIPTVNAATQQLVVATVHLLKQNEDDPATTYPGTTFGIPPFNLDPDQAGNLLDLVLILVTLTIVIVSRAARGSQEVSLYVLGLVAGFIVFCAVFRWQPWHTRLQLPLFVLWSSAIGVVWERQFRAVITEALGAALILSALPAALLNETRPLINRDGLSVVTAPRERLYFTARPWLFDSYRKAASVITQSSCQNVGIDIHGDQYEYAWMVLLGVKPGGRQIHYVGREPDPVHTDPVCAVICTRCRPLRFDLYKSEFGAPEIFDGVDLFGPSPPTHPRGGVDTESELEP